MVKTEAAQLILCQAWIDVAGEMPEYANAMWYVLLTPGIQPQESLLSQGTYHVKEISRNGNFAYVVVCHPTIGARFGSLWWREAGYRAEIVTTTIRHGLPEAFESLGYVGDYELMGTIKYPFEEVTFSVDNL